MFAQKDVLAFSVLYGLTTATLYQGHDTKQTFFVVVVCFSLIWCSVSDVRNYIIPNACVVAISMSSIFYLLSNSPAELPIRIGTAITIFWCLWLIGEIYFRRFKKDGLGIGDAKLFAALSLAIGAENLPMLLFLSSSGGIFAVLLNRTPSKGEFSNGLPFAPFIAYPAFVMILLN